MTENANGRPSPILYLYEYDYVPEDILLAKNDEELTAPAFDGVEREDFAGSTELAEPELPKLELPELLCVGVGTYRTRAEGPLYLCVLIDPASRRIFSWSVGVYRSCELVGRALERLFAMGDLTLPTSSRVTLRSSRNSLYRSGPYRDLLAKYPVSGELTEPGTRGGVMAVSTFFSRLMIRKGGYEFADWQDGVDWLGRYLVWYNGSLSGGSYYGKGVL